MSDTSNEHTQTPLLVSSEINVSACQAPFHICELAIVAPLTGPDTYRASRSHLRGASSLSSAFTPESMHSTEHSMPNRSGCLSLSGSSTGVGDKAPSAFFLVWSLKLANDTRSPGVHVSLGTGGWFISVIRSQDLKQATFNRMW